MSIDENYTKELCDAVAKTILNAFENLTIEDVNMYQLGYNKALDDMINIIKEMRETAQFLMKTDYEYACDRFIEQAEQLIK